MQTNGKGSTGAGPRMQAMKLRRIATDRTCQPCINSKKFRHGFTATATRSRQQERTPWQETKYCLSFIALQPLSIERFFTDSQHANAWYDDVKETQHVFPLTLIGYRSVGKVMDQECIPKYKLDTHGKASTRCL